MKTTLQQRAEHAADRFRRHARRPIVIEFAGMPKAGNSSTIGQIHSFLKRSGFNVRIVVERASVCPIRDKKHATFNVWTACMTLAQILENTQDPPRADDPDVLILDRGIFDAICWLTTMERLSRITSADRAIVEKFLLVDEWRNRINGVILMTASPEDALKREQGFLSATGTGSIMNAAVLERMLATTLDCARRLEKSFRICEVDTSSSKARSPEKTAKVVADMILNLIEEHLAEEILHVSKAAVSRCFNQRTAIVGTAAEAALALFRDEGSFKPREGVEADANLIQALPVVIVRNHTGQILQLRRRERDEDNPLHQKVVCWAGGHVRKEDAENGDAIIHCIRRELNEELRLSVEEDELRFLGAVYVDTGGKTSQHVALVYEWQAKSDDVAVSLSTAEFFERRGTSLSGKFVSYRDLVNQLRKGDGVEPWSAEIIRTFLSAPDVAIDPELF